ncbi:Aspartic peptidase domain containing protein [Tylopilus felleus]
MVVERSSSFEQKIPTEQLLAELLPSRPCVASTSTGFEGVDGIVGIGLEDLTEGILTDEPDAEIATVTQNLYTQEIISEEVVGVFFAPTTTTLTFGGTDSSKYTGTISYTSVFPLDAYSAYQSATGATYDDNTGLLTFTTAQYDALQNLGFNIGSVTYALTPNGQIWPRSLNTYLGGTSGSIYGIANDLGTPSGEGLDDGQTFLERFYSVFDTTNSRVGFAATEYTDATTN